MLSSVLAYLVLGIGVPLNALVTYLLWREAARDPGIAVLRERLVVAVIVLAVVIVFGLIFLNNDFIPPSISTEVTKLVTRATMLGIAIVPASYWLWLYWRRRH